MGNKKRSAVNRWGGLEEQLRAGLPHLMSFLLDADEFGELRLKARPDGTVLSIAKGFGSDGGPVVCFGVGYDVTLALMAIDSTIQGNNWKVDKPWDKS